MQHEKIPQYQSLLANTIVALLLLMFAADLDVPYACCMHAYFTPVVTPDLEYPSIATSFMSNMFAYNLTMVVCRCRCFSHQESATSMLNGGRPP